MAQTHWGGEPVRAHNVTYAVRIEAAANQEAIQELIAHTDRVAEIPNSLRLGATVTLTDAQAISVRGN